MTRWQTVTRWVRPQDLVWVVLVASIHWLGPVHNEAEIEVLIGLAAWQLITPRFSFFGSAAGKVMVVLGQMLLCYLLIGVTDGVESSYYWVLLLPIITAANTLSIWWTMTFTAIACATYLSFLLFVNFDQTSLSERALRELALRSIFFAFVAYAVHELSAESQREARNYQVTAEQLAEANVHLREAEEAMRRTERLAALGQLTAGLAHELRNPMGTMKSSAELLAKRIPPGDEIGQELTGFIKTEVDRANSLITRFLQFARPFHLQRANVEIASVVDRAIVQVERHAPAFDVDFVRNYSPDVPALALDAELMEQVFVNLLMNAAQASPPRSLITVKTRAAEGMVEVAVIDRGKGIDARHRESIFNPFFTTRPDGVGLGLAIVQKIVDEHGGRMIVESEPGQGAVFRVHLPATRT
jgi:two-component system, NtrC family, sensor histidine kinase HydH